MPTIDESVVKLSLDDSQFDKASDRTISKLDDLKKSLQFDGAVEGFKEIEKAAKQTDFSPMEKGVQTVTNQFNALYTIADQTFRRMTDWLITNSKNLVSSLTIDNVAAGWDKYAEKTGAVQTIMASTADQFEDTAVQMEYVEGQLEKLNWFTDETSYKFLDMANNIGKFTANEVGLDDAVTAMQGISNWAAISGAGIRGASMAMYNLAQAISMGSLKLQDWRSIELANMGTAEFKRVAMEAGEAAGELIKLSDGVYKTVAKGTEVTTKSFRNSLSEGWLTTEVLMNTLNKYGDFTNELYKFAEATDLSATPLLRYIEEYKKGTLDIEDAMVSTGMAADELTEWLERLGSEEYDLGRRALRAAQEAKTFQEAIDAVKEAVGTGWSNTFEAIFGNYEEAKELWSDFAEGLYEVFVESGNMRNGLLRDWKALGGRTYLIEGIYNLFGKLRDAVFFFKDTFEEIFPPKTAEQLRDMTKGFRDLMEALTPSETIIQAVHDSLVLLFTVIQKIGQVAAVLFFGLEPIWELLVQIGSAIIGLVGDISRLAGINISKIFSVKNLTDFYNLIYSISSVIANFLRGGLLTVLDIIGNIIGFVDKIWRTFKNGEGGIKGFINAIVINFKELFNTFSNGNGISGFVENIIGSIQKLFNKIVSGQSIFSGVFYGIYTVASSVFSGISNLIVALFDSFNGENIDSNPIVTFFTNIGNAIRESNIVDNIGSALSGLLNFISNLIGGMDGLSAAGEGLHNTISWFIDQFGVLWDWFVDELTKMNFRDIVDVLILVGIMEVIQAFKTLTLNLATVPSGLTGILTSIKNVIDTFSGNGLNTMTSNMATFVTKSKYLQMAIAIGVLTDGLIKLSTIDTGKLGTAVAAIVTVMGVLSGFIALMQKFNSDTPPAPNGNDNSTTINFPGLQMVLQYAIAIRLMAGAVSTIADLIEKDGNIFERYEGIVVGIGGLGAIMAAIYLFAKNMSAMTISADLIKTASALALFAVGIDLLLLPVAILAGMAALDLPAAVTGILGISAMMISLSFALQMLLKNIDEKTTGKRITAAAIAMLSMATALTLLSASVFAFSQLKIEELAQGLISVILMIVALSKALGSLNKGLSSDTTGKRIIATGAALISMAVAIDLLAAAMYGLSKIPFEALGVAIAAFVVAIGGLAAAGYVAQTFSDGLEALALVMVASAGSFALFAFGIKTLVEAVGEFVVIAAVLMAAASQLGDDFPAMVEKGFSYVEIVIREFLHMIPRLAGDIAGAVVALILSVKHAIIFALPDILNAILIVGTAVLELLAKFAEPIMKALTDLIYGLAENIRPLLDACAYFIEELFSGIGPILQSALIGLVAGVIGIISPKLADKFRESAHAASDSFADGLENGVISKSSSIAETAGAGVWSAFTGQTVKFEEAGNTLGGALGEGIVDGIESKQYDVNTASGNMMNGAIITMANAGDIHSPSGITTLLGQFMGEGFVNGLDSMGDSVNNSGLNMMSQYFSGMMTGLDTGGSTLSKGMDALARMMGVKADAIVDIASFSYGVGKDFGLIDPDMKGINPQERLKTAKEQIKKSVEKATDESFDIGKDLGTSLGSGIDSGLSKSTGKSGGRSSTSEKVKTAAEEIIESYEEVLAEMDYLDKKRKGEYDLFSILNPDLDELEKNTNKLEYINGQIETQLKRTETYEERYKKIAEAMGEASKEARDAELEWIDQQVTLAELQQEAVETQAAIIDDAATQLELEQKNAELTYNLWESNNQNASEREKLQRKLAYTMEKLEYTSKSVTEAEKAYAEAVEKYGEESNAAKEALNELVQTQIDYQDLLNEQSETEESIIELERKRADTEFEIATIMHENWESRNKNATEEEKLAKKQQLYEKEYQKALAERERAYENFSKLLKELGADANETQEALKIFYEADAKVIETHEKVMSRQIEELEIIENKVNREKEYIDAIRELWAETNESLTTSAKRVKESKDLAEDLEHAYTQLVIIDQKIAQAVRDYGESSEEVASLRTEYVKQQTEIVKIKKEQKDLNLTLLKDAETELSYERKRLELEETIWQTTNQNAEETVANAHRAEKIQSDMVLTQRELNNLSEQYAYMVERYGESSKEALDAWFEYKNKMVEILELQNEMLELQESITQSYMSMIDAEADMLNAASTRANLENQLWEALNEDASDSEKNAKKLSYQMQSLEAQTNKLRNASKKYNYALKMYGEEAAETQELYNSMLQAQIDYAQTYNEIKTLQLDSIEKNNEILEQLQYSEKLLDYGYNMWSRLNEDLADAQKIEAEIKKLNQSMVTQVAKANYYGAEWKKAVAQYGSASSEAQEAYLNYLEALYNALDVQQTIAEREQDLADWRTENAQKLQDAWDEIKTPDLAGGTSIYDELVEMGMSEAEIEAYVKEKAGYIEEAINTEMDFSIESMQKKAEESLREWGLTWVDGTYDVATDVVSNTGNCMAEMTDIIAEGASEGQSLAEEAMDEIEKLTEEGAEEIVETAEDGAEEILDTTEEGMEDIADTIDDKGEEIIEAFKGVIDEMIWWAEKGSYDDLIETGHSIVYTIGQGITTNKWSIIDRIIEVCEEAIWWAMNQDYESIGSYMTQGISQGISREKWNVIDSMVSVVEDAIWAANQTAQINSPSRVTMWMGEMLDAGFVEGIENRAGEIAKALSRTIQNGISAMKKIVHTSNTLDFVDDLVSGGILGGIEGYSYNILSVGQAVLNELADEYDEFVDEAIGDNQWLIDALREYGFDETTHSIDFILNLDATDAKTQIEELFDAREADLDYYDELLKMQERNAEKDQKDLAVKAEAQAINRELNRVLNEIASYERELTNIVSSGRATNSDDTISAKKLEYVQNIYSVKPLSALDIYRNTNSQLLRFTTWR